MARDGTTTEDGKLRNRERIGACETMVLGMTNVHATLVPPTFAERLAFHCRAFVKARLRHAIEVRVDLPGVDPPRSMPAVGVSMQPCASKTVAPMPVGSTYPHTTQARTGRNDKNPLLGV